jgi:hypothetical protein
MISIIICSYNTDKIAEIELNISETVGVEYELIIIDNRKSLYNIFQAYNLGVKNSKFSIVCFMHDDIVYHSNNWGQEVVNYFNSKDTGMIGIGGTRFLSSIPTIWWAGGHKYFTSRFGTVCHNSIDTNRNDLEISQHNVINPENAIFTRVAVLDGLWFCVRKELFKIVSFDEKNYNGFHFYDLDISMQINNLNYNIFCIFNIQLEHISASKHDKDWIESCNVFYHKWKAKLPISYVCLPLKQIISVEYMALKIFRDIHVSNNINFSWLNLLKKISIYNLILFHLKSLLRMKYSQFCI